MQFPTSRGAFYGGLGAGGFGAGSPLVPGVWANFHLADAIFLPLAAEQATGARRGAAGTARNDTLLRVANAYLELLRAEQELAIAVETRQHAQRLSDVTAAYAKAGQGLVSDADRAATELSLRKNNVVRAEEAVAVASARLAQLLRLDPTAQFQPIEPVVTPLHLVAIEQGVDELIAQGLSTRPELFEARLPGARGDRPLSPRAVRAAHSQRRLGREHGGDERGRGHAFRRRAGAARPGRDYLLGDAQTSATATRPRGAKLRRSFGRTSGGASR